MKTKAFDCVDMKHRGACIIQGELKGKSQEQQLQYWQGGTEELKRLQKQLRSETNTQSP